MYWVFELPSEIGYYFYRDVCGVVFIGKVYEVKVVNGGGDKYLFFDGGDGMNFPLSDAYCKEYDDVLPSGEWGGPIVMPDERCEVKVCKVGVNE